MDEQSGGQWYFTKLIICLLKKLSVHPHLDYPRLDHNVVWTNVIWPDPRFPHRRLILLSCRIRGQVSMLFCGGLLLLSHCPLCQFSAIARCPKIGGIFESQQCQWLTYGEWTGRLSLPPAIQHLCHRCLPPPTIKFYHHLQRCDSIVPAACEQSSNHFFRVNIMEGGLGVCTAFWHFLLLEASSNDISLSRAWYCTLLSKGPCLQTKDCPKMEALETVVD